MDDSTVEALCEVLRDMTTAIELISSGERSGEALINFIEEMLKTIEAWAAKYNVILDYGGMAMESAQDYHRNPSVISDVHSFPDHAFTNPQSHVTAADVTHHKDVKQPPIREHNHTGGERCHQHLESSNQDERGKDEKGVEEFSHASKHETQMDEWQVVDGPTDKPSRRVSRRTRSQAESFSDGDSIRIDGTASSDDVAKMNSPQPLTKNLKTEATPIADDTTPSQGFGRTGDVIDSPTWLPKGWVTELKGKGAGGSSSLKDKHYFDPTSQRRFRSKKEVLAFLGTTKRKRGRPRKSESLGEQPAAQTEDESARHTASIESIQECDASLAPEVQVSSNTFSDDLMMSSPAVTSVLATSAQLTQLATTDSTITLDTT